MSKAIVYSLIGLVALSLLGGGFILVRRVTSPPSTETVRQSTQPISSKAAVVIPNPSKNAAASVSWEFDGAAWKSIGTPPACPDPIIAQSPVDLSLASGILYPGQTRGGDYKPHGGFRFDGKKNDDVTVKAPFDAMLVKASRYTQMGETQHLLHFTAPCGLIYRFDHLLVLTPKFQKIMEALPPPAVDDSRTTVLNTPVAVTSGEVIATAVGFTAGPNVSVDFGLYDLRKTNGTSHPTNKEFAPYGLCWLNLLPAADSAKAKTLPGTSEEGKTSDYCR